MTEQWKPVHGYEGLYEVSNLVNVKSLGRTVKRGFGMYNYPPRMLTKKDNSQGYYRVRLTDASGNQKAVFVHRMVADAFLEKEEGLNVVNHKDFDHHNNTVDSLEWTTAYGNFRYSFDRGRYDYTDERRKKLKRSLCKKMSKPVISINLRTGERRKFDTLNSTAEYGFQPSCVSNCCNGTRLTHGGCAWMFAEAENGS